jgi:hypothetical protein
MSAAIIIPALVLLIIVALLFLRRPPAASGGARAKDLEAQRFAKLLIADMKLNDRGQIGAGRRNKDLYLRLQGEIDRARRLYDERVGRNVAERADYFHEELVREIAGGDQSALGPDYRRGRE